MPRTSNASQEESENDAAMNPIVYPVKDLAKAKELPVRRLCAVDPYVDEPYYVGFRMGDQSWAI